MWQTLYEYFILYRKLTIPGIGSFQVEPLVARLDFANKLLHAPLPAVRFTHDHQQPDHFFIKYLSDHYRIDENEASKRFNDFSDSLHDEIEKNGTVTLKGIGKLKKEFAKTYSFHPFHETDRYFPDVKVERVIRKHSKHYIKVGEAQKTNVEMEELLQNESGADQWKRYALVLAITAIVAIVVYHLSH
jgi:hypothetical protein